MVPPPFIKFDRKYRRMRASIRSLPHDPKFNSFHWLRDCWILGREIEFSVSKMEERAEEYRRQVAEGDRPEHVDRLVSYYADNAVLRLMSFRDKLALCLWSFFNDFNPYQRGKLLNLESVVKRLSRMKSARRVGEGRALAILKPLRQREPKILSKCRHLKVHRREPRVELYSVAQHHDWPYLVHLEGKNIDCPPRKHTNVTFKKAPKAKNKESEQTKLFKE